MTKSKDEEEKEGMKSTFFTCLVIINCKITFITCMHKYLCKILWAKIMEWLDGWCGDLFLRHTSPFFQSPSLQFAFLCNYIANCDTILSYIFVFVTLALYGSLLLLRFYLISSSHIIIFIVKHTHLYLTLCGSLHLICLASLWACKLCL